MQNYLTPEGQQIYKELEQLLLNESQDHLLNSWELSRLADAYYKYEYSSKLINERFEENMTDKTFAQTKIYLTWKESGATINRLAGQFGLTPRSRTVLNFKSKSTETNPLADFSIE